MAMVSPSSKDLFVGGASGPCISTLLSDIIDPMLLIPSQREKPMTNLGAGLAMLKKERDKLNRAIAALSGSTGSSGGGRRKLSAAAREKIAAAQRKRWAKFKKNNAR